uniref:JmjC domain-containing protein n=1 Tax=Odontella aurita TaxID=265563 RepID=A0A7S4MKJ7_9STRA
MTIKPLPKVHVNEITPKQFDDIFLDRLPVIITGTTACPAELDLDTLEQHCGGWVPGNYVKVQADPEDEEEKGEWAGLEDAGDPDERVDLLEFARRMGPRSRGEVDADIDAPPRYMFDVSMTNLCPSLLRDVRVPSHFVGAFASQYLWRRYERDDPRKCSNMPFMNLYLAEKWFETDLHIDSAHTSFVASMCEGRKRWRVLSRDEFADHRPILAMARKGAMIEVDDGDGNSHGTWVNAEIRRPFDTWSRDSALTLEESIVDFDVFEGTLQPGEILYIPPGAPHAAVTLDDSIMVASNDQSIQSLREIGLYCDEDPSWFGCGHFREKLSVVEANYEDYRDNVAREETTFAEAFDCERAVESLSRTRLELSRQNIEAETGKGAPIIVMKYVRNCLHCVRLLDMLDILGDSSATKIRFAVLNCPGGDCHGGNTTKGKIKSDYDRILEMTRDEPPEFVYVAAATGPQSRGGSAVRGMFSDDGRGFDVSHYYGPLDADFLKVWINARTGERLYDDVSPRWMERWISCWHRINGATAASLRGVGVPPTADDVAWISAFVVLFALATPFLLVCYARANEPSVGEKKKI